MNTLILIVVLDNYLQYVIPMAIYAGSFMWILFSFFVVSGTLFMSTICYRILKLRYKIYKRRKANAEVSHTSFPKEPSVSVKQNENAGYQVTVINDDSVQEEPVPKYEMTRSEQNDQLFSQNLNKVIDEHLDDPYFNINELSDIMCMDRTGLYRKTKRIEHTTPSGLLKMKRIRLVKKYIDTVPGILMDELRAKSGFRTIKDMANCFQKIYGVSIEKYMAERNS